VLSLALACTVLVSTYVVRIKTMWRQGPITAAVVIASALTYHSAEIGIERGLHKVAEVIFGCLVGVVVSLVMARLWLVQPSGETDAGA
jgi:acid phosphatase family membrane protein YuiD